MVSQALLSIEEKYGLAGTSPQQLCIAKILDTLLTKAKKIVPELFEELTKKELHVLDVGCGYFRYGPSLAAIMKKINPSISLWAVDKKKFFREYSPATFVKGDVEQIAFSGIDIVTVFNPFPGIPNLSKISSPKIFIGCIDWNPTLFKQTLKENNFEPLVWLDNPYKEVLRPWFNNYDPFVFAIKR